MNNDRNSFMFYLNWEEQIDLLNDEELRRMIKNLIRYHQGKELTLLTPIENMCWAGIKPGLDTNIAKYDKKVEANRKNGKFGGAPKGNQNATKEKTTQTTQNNPNNPIIDNRKEIIDNSKLETGNWEKENEKREKKTLLTD